MLAPIRHLIDLKRIVLASGSPRRHELVRAIGLNTELCPSTFEENLDPSDFKEFSDFVVATAMGKAEEVFERLSKEPGSDPNHLIVIAADTMVTLNNEVYGKPKDSQDAIRMLTKLSGTCNRVYTGVVLKYHNGARQFTETADVYFGNLTQAQIEAYVATGEPLDKAGAYGVQGLGGSLIARVEGDFYCVMGLPLHRLCYELSLYLEEDASSRALNLGCH